jgi:hypothetical protein
MLSTQGGDLPNIRSLSCMRELMRFILAHPPAKQFEGFDGASDCKVLLRSAINF